MRTIIAGSRGITDYARLTAAIQAASLFEDIDPSLIVGGKAEKGVDPMGERYATETGLPFKGYPPDWKQGPTAGFARNYTMAQNADALIALWDGKSPGTKHMIDLARKYGLKVYVDLG